MEAVREKKRTKKKAQTRPATHSISEEYDILDPVIPEIPAFEVISPDVVTHQDLADKDDSLTVLCEEESESKTEQNEEDIATAHLPLPTSVEEVYLAPVAPPTTVEEFKLPDLTDLQREQAEEDVREEEHAPSAPELCDLDFYQIQQINRSILNEIHDIQSQSTMQTISIQLPPFTDQERNQYYFNIKLGAVLSFEVMSKRYFADQFDQMRKGHLHRELEAYYDLQRNIHNLNMDITQLKEAFPKIRKKIWTVKFVSKTFTQKCCQALSNESVCVRFLTGAYSENWAMSFKDSLTNYANICCASHRGKVILRELQMLTISTLIQEIIDNSSVTPRRDELRLTLTTLFHFVVKKTATKDFRDNVKNWLERILVVFNKFSLLDDQLFLMSHILRCPTEAALQVVKAVNISHPGKRIDEETIDDWLAILWHSLRPILQWQKKSNEHKTERDTNWAIVDSEGEDADEDGEDVKYPNEVIFLEVLDRMPLKKIFEGLLNVQEMGDAIYLSAHNLLRMIIFSSAFVGVVTEGLSSYQKDRYKTFLKRLAGIVKWTADLVTALYDLYRSVDGPKDVMVVVRLETEYNIFMIRVADHLFKNRSVLQYLSQLNFSYLEKNTYWKLNYYLLTSFPKDATINYHEDFRVKMLKGFSFSSSLCTISQWSPEELYFVLESLSSLAMGCGDRDLGFMEHIVQSLFHVGFVLDMVREKCYKSVRDLLMAVTVSYPSMIEIILRDILLNLSLINTQSVYMLKVLPYDDWRPTMEIVDAISDMLENYALDSVQHNIGKLLISYMNWGQLKCDDGQPVLGHEYHCKAAMLVLTATIKKFPKSESYKRISLAGVDSDPEKRYIAWTWKMITKLRLHSMDQNAVAKLQKIENNAINVIPMMKVEFIPTMHRLVEEEKNPLALYIAILLCDIGNSTGEVLAKGLPLLSTLLETIPFFIITRCLDLIVPLFLNSSDELIKSEACGKIIDCVLEEERSLLGLQLSWKANEVVQQFAEMVVNQILNLHLFGWQSVQKITWLWLMLLTRNSTWATSNNCLFVLENIFRIAATIPGLLDTCRECLYPLNMELKLKHPGSRKSFVPRSVNTFPWCSLIFIELDFYCYEQLTNVWVKLIDRMSVEGKKNVNQTVKDLTKDFGASDLSVFKWAEFLLKLDRQSPVFSVALVQYWRLFRIESVLEHNPGLVHKVKVKLLAKEETEEKDSGSNEATKRKLSFFVNVAERRTTTIENSLEFVKSFVLDFIHMSALRNEVKQMTDHWSLIAFRQDIKRRGTPSQTSRGVHIQVALKEKRLRILEMVKSQREPDVFTVPSVEFNVSQVLKKARQGSDLPYLLKDVIAEYSNAMRLVERQKQLEFQLYIQRLISYTKTKRCGSCLASVGIPVKYTELVMSSDNGDGNMAMLMNIDSDENALKDEGLVIYFFSVLHNLRVCGTKCEEGDHSDCDRTLKLCFDIYTRGEGDVRRRFDFVEDIFAAMKISLKLLMRRHCGTHYKNTIQVMAKNPSMALLIAEVLGHNELDDALYMKVLQDFVAVLKDVQTLETCLGLMKIGDRASREGVTESYRMSTIRFIFANLPSQKNAIFDLLAKELFVVMLRRIDLMPNIMHLSFHNVSIRHSSNLMISLMNVLGLAKENEMLRSDYVLPLERVDQIDHLFPYEAIDLVFELLINFRWPDVVVNEGAFIAFFELLSYLLIRKNTTNGPELLHNRICLLYKPFIYNAIESSYKLRVTGLFKSVQYLPEAAYLGCHLRYYLVNMSTIHDSLEMHKIYVLEMKQLPWNRFTISADVIAEIYRALRTHHTKKDHMSVMQSVCSDIVVKVKWDDKIELFYDPQILNMMFFVAIRVPYELLDGQTETVLKFYESTQKIPWHTIDERVFSETLDWIVLSYSQLAFIPNLTGNIVEMGMFKLLLEGACISGKANADQSWAEVKKRKFYAAMIRLFSMSVNCEKATVQASLREFLMPIANHYSSEQSQEIEAFYAQLLGLIDEKALFGPYLSVVKEHVSNCDNAAYLTAFLRTVVSVEVVNKGRAQIFEHLLRVYFAICVGDDRCPWKTVEKLTLPLVLRLRLDYLKDMELYLTMHLFIMCNLKMCNTDQKRISFADDLLNWLPNIQFDEVNEVYLLLLWSQVVCTAANLHFKGVGSALLEKSLKFLRSTTAVRAVGWGKSLFSAIGLSKMQRQELCVGYIIYLLVKCFPELRESSSETSLKFAQQFEADLKSSKVSNFQTALSLLFGSAGSMVPEHKEDFSKSLVGFLGRLNPQQSGWFQNVHDFWAIPESN